MVQNVGACGLVLQEDYREGKRGSTQSLYQLLRKQWPQENAASRWGDEPRSFHDVRSSGIEYFDMSNWFVIRGGIPSALVSGGWPVPSGHAGTPQDTLKTACLDSVEDTARFLAAAIPALAAWKAPEVPACEREFPWEC